jgi:ABC-type Zn uptake system ZnuABC Zn-binding protein ZnuA
MLQMQMMKWMMGILAVYTMVILIIALGLHSLKARQLATGSMCVVVSIAMYASPLSVMVSPCINLNQAP